MQRKHCSKTIITNITNRLVRMKTSIRSSTTARHIHTHTQSIHIEKELSRTCITFSLNIRTSLHTKCTSVSYPIPYDHLATLNRMLLKLPHPVLSIIIGENVSNLQVFSIVGILSNNFLFVFFFSSFNLIGFFFGRFFRTYQSACV